MAGNRAMLFTCRDRLWHEMPLWAPGVIPEVVWEMLQRAPLSQHCSSFHVPIYRTWVSSPQWSREAAWFTSQSETQVKMQTLPLTYGNERVDNRLNFWDGLLTPWRNEHNNRSHLQRQLGTLKMHKRRKQATYFMRGPQSSTWKPKQQLPPTKWLPFNQTPARVSGLY